MGGIGGREGWGGDFMAFGNNTRSSRPLAGSSVCAYSCVSVCASSWKAIATGQRIKPNVANLGATARGTDASAHPKQQPRQARRTTSRGQWRGVRPLPMTPTPPRQGRNVRPNQATSSTATNKSRKEQSKTSSMARVLNVCACVRGTAPREHTHRRPGHPATTHC